MTNLRQKQTLLAGKKCYITQIQMSLTCLLKLFGLADCHYFIKMLGCMSIMVCQYTNYPAPSIIVLWIVIDLGIPVRCSKMRLPVHYVRKNLSVCNKSKIRQVLCYKLYFYNQCLK